LSGGERKASFLLCLDAPGCLGTLFFFYFFSPAMAKSKNHTNNNQTRKAHRNGIKRPAPHTLLPTRGMPEKQLEALREEKYKPGVVSKKKTMSFEERYALENRNPAVLRARMIKRLGVRKMALNGVYLN
jgi:large subunit ribosomal protein L29e